jgi:hypothetical protein
MRGNRTRARARARGRAGQHRRSSVAPRCPHDRHYLRLRGQCYRVRRRRAPGFAICGPGHRQLADGEVSRASGWRLSPPGRRSDSPTYDRYLEIVPDQGRKLAKHRKRSRVPTTSGAGASSRVRRASAKGSQTGLGSGCKRPPRWGWRSNCVAAVRPITRLSAPSTTLTPKPAFPEGSSFTADLDRHRQHRAREDDHDQHEYAKLPPCVGPCRQREQPVT